MPMQGYGVPYVPPEEQIPPPQQQVPSPGLGGGGLMSPKDYNEALFLGPEGYPPQQYTEPAPQAAPPADTSMYAAPVEAQYQPGGSNYLPPYQPPAAQPVSSAANPYAAPSSTYGAPAQAPQPAPMRLSSAQTASPQPTPQYQQRRPNPLGGVGPLGPEYVNASMKTGMGDLGAGARWAPSTPPPPPLTPVGTVDQGQYYARIGQMGRGEPQVIGDQRAHALGQQQAPTFTNPYTPPAPATQQQPQVSGTNWWDPWTQAAGNIIPGMIQWITPGLEPGPAQSARDAQDAVGGMVLEEGYPTNRAGTAGHQASEQVIEPFVNSLAGKFEKGIIATNPYANTLAKGHVPTFVSGARQAQTDQLPTPSYVTQARQAQVRNPQHVATPTKTSGLPPVGRGDVANRPAIDNTANSPVALAIRPGPDGALRTYPANRREFPTARPLTDAEVQTLMANLPEGTLGAGWDKVLTETAVALPPEWRDIIAAGTPAITTASTATSSGSGSSGSGSEWVDYGSKKKSGWVDYGSGGGYGRSSGGYGYGGYGSDGAVAPETFFAQDAGDGEDSSMWDNPIFARYFAVLEGRYGREGAMRRMRSLSKRFRFRGRMSGSRSSNPRSKTRTSPISKGGGNDSSPSVPSNDAIRKDVTKRVKKATT